MNCHIHKINRIMNININNTHVAYSLYYSFNIIECFGDICFNFELYMNKQILKKIFTVHK